MRRVLPALLLCLAALPARAEQLDFTAPVLLFSDAPRFLAENCPSLAGSGGDCRIESVTAWPEGQDWLTEARVRLYRADGGEQALRLAARLDSRDCALKDRSVQPPNATANRLLTMTERRIRLARRDAQGMQRFCLLLQGMVERRRIPDCLCRP